MVKIRELAEGAIALRSGSKSGTIMNVDNFLFTCAPSALLNGLASGALGMLFLGRTQIDLQPQLSLIFDLHKKFATCLSFNSNEQFTNTCQLI